jgi:hypothetical protein
MDTDNTNGFKQINPVASGHLPGLGVVLVETLRNIIVKVKKLIHFILSGSEIFFLSLCQYEENLPINIKLA